MFEMEIYGVLLVPIIIGVVQLFKMAGLAPRFAGLVALALGLIIALAYGLTEAGWTLFQCLIIGAALGLSASGLYSTQKNVRELSDEGPSERT